MQIITVHVKGHIPIRLALSPPSHTTVSVYPSSMTSPDVSIKLSHRLDKDGEFNAFTKVSVDILYRRRTVGKIQATVVHSQRIPANYFMSAMDGHSDALQYVGVTLFEPRLGRTKLASLAESDKCDNYARLDFIYIRSFHVDEKYKAKKGASEIGATALHQLLHHSFIDENNVAAAVYILDPFEAMTTVEQNAHDEKRRNQSLLFLRSGGKTPPESTDSEEARQDQMRMDILARADANQFLRNGFFQDPAIARDDPRFLVASYRHLTRGPPISHKKAAVISFYTPPKMPPPPPMGKDKELFSLVMETRSMSSPATGLELEIEDEEELVTFNSKIARLLLSEGASISRSHAIHVASFRNNLSVLLCLLDLEPAAIHGRDHQNFTPLMLAAQSVAAGQQSTCSMEGINDTRVVDALLARGACINDQDSVGMTAYGHFVKSYDSVMSSRRQAMIVCGKSTARADELLLDSKNKVPGMKAFVAKLFPAGGPSKADLTGGKATADDDGFVDYTEQDRAAGFDSEDDESSKGDY